MLQAQKCWNTKLAEIQISKYEKPRSLPTRLKIMEFTQRKNGLHYLCSMEKLENLVKETQVQKLIPGNVAQHVTAQQFEQQLEARPCCLLTDTGAELHHLGLKRSTQKVQIKKCRFLRYLDYDTASRRMRDGGYLVFSIDSLKWQKIMYLNLCFVNVVLFSASGNWRDILQHKYCVFCQSFKDP